MLPAEGNRDDDGPVDAGDTVWIAGGPHHGLGGRVREVKRNLRVAVVDLATTDRPTPVEVPTSLLCRARQR